MPALRLFLSAASAISVLAWAAPSANAQEYVLGLSVPLSGQTAFIGESALKAIRLKVEQINEGGGIHGHKIRLDAQDDKCDPTTGVNIAQRFVNDDNVVGMLGPFCS